MKIEYRDGKWLVLFPAFDGSHQNAEGDTLIDVKTPETIVASCSSKLLAYTSLIDHYAALVAGAALDESKLLPEHWTADPLTTSTFLDDVYGRDFTNCAWSWRDPETMFVPLMWQSTNEGHYGAELAGFFTAFGQLATGGTRGDGRFYNNDAGRALRDTIAASGFVGISADPAKVDVEEVCLETSEDEWGTYCSKSKMVFHSYEVAGATALGIPGMEDAILRFQAPEEILPAVEVKVSVAASARTITAPPRALFEIPEPRRGQSGMLSTYGMPVEEILIGQGDGTYAVPVTIAEVRGQLAVYGNVARWGQCHTGYEDVCVTPPTSLAAYRHFMTGATVTAEGDTLPTGVLTVGCDHAPLRGISPSEARDRYAHTGLGWADVRIIDGEFGPWLCGAVRPDVGEDLLRVLRASALSGDWRGIDGHLEMVAVLSVNTPGFPLSRLTASIGGREFLPEVRTNVAMDDTPIALVAAGLVRRPTVELAEPDCGCGTLAPARRDPAMRELLAKVSAIELRTRHLRPVEAEALAASLTD